jgi:cysteinyl-tRNA synthetase
LTYEIPGDGIYYDTSKDPHYGELAGLHLDAQKAGARLGEEAVANKRNPSDFALWKFSPTDEQRAMEWDSPWGKGFPGWHIECSAMSIKYLGEQFAIHTGGIDHIPVHHPNEIAQAENATGKRPFVQIWVHHNFLRIESQKMSKSLNNFVTVDDVVERGFDPMALKLLFFAAHYRDELNFTWDSLAGSQKAWERLQRKISLLLTESEWESWSEVPEVTGTLLPAVQTILDLLQDDLKTPQALAQFWGVLKKATPQDLPQLKMLLDILGLKVGD